MNYSRVELTAKRYTDEELKRFEWVPDDIEPNTFAHPFKTVRNHPIGLANFERWGLVTGEVREYVEPEPDGGVVDPLALLGEALAVLGTGEGVQRGLRRYTNPRTGETGPWIFISEPEPTVGPSSGYEYPADDPLVPVDQLEAAYLQRENEDRWEAKSLDMHHRQVRYLDDADAPGGLTLITGKMIHERAGGAEGEVPKLEDVQAEKKVRAQLEAERRKKAAKAKALKTTTEPKPDAPIHPLDDPANSHTAEDEAKRQAIIARSD